MDASPGSGRFVVVSLRHQAGLPAHQVEFYRQMVLQADQSPGASPDRGIRTDDQGMARMGVRMDGTNVITVQVKGALTPEALQQLLDGIELQ